MAEALQDDLHFEISKLVSRTLYRDGVSSSTLKVSQSFAYLIEYINRELHDVNVLLSGSLVEGSQVKGSDVDQMLIFPRLRAYIDSKQALNENDNILVIDTKKTRYGFSRLRVERIQKDDTIQRQLIEQCSAKDKDGAIYLSSDNFIQFNLNLEAGTDKFSSFGQFSPTIFRHGPCTSIEYGAKDTHMSPAGESDIAIGIECTGWPIETVAWSSRVESAKWPPNYLVDRIKQLPCFLLPVGDPTSQHCAIEWRFAFVPTERELIWAFYDTQIQCYVLLKLIKKNFLDPLAPDQLSSFLLKTIVMWEIGKDGIDNWNPRSLLTCLHRCLETLHGSIQSLELPHYIFEKRNLLYSKFSEPMIQEAVMEKIREVQKLLVPSVLQSATQDGPLYVLKKIWEACDDDVATLVQIGSFLIPEDQTLFKRVDQAKKCLNGINTAYSIVHLPTTVARLVNVAEYIKDNSGQFEEFIGRKTACYIAIQIGYRCLAETEITKDESKITKLNQVASLFFEEGAQLDNASGLLHLATYFYKRGEKYKAMQIISAFDSKKEELFFVGKCSAKWKLDGTYGKGYNGFAELNESNVAYDVIFTSEDVSCVPDAVKFECVLLGNGNNFCLFHPLVYGYSLLFQICFDRNNSKGCSVCTEELTNILKINVSSLERHRALNMLGYCLRKTGRFQEAIECFRESIQIMPSNGNAATYHLGVMFTNLI